MSRNVAINGFGRIGRLAYRRLIERDDMSVVAVNDIAPADNLAYLLRHDSVQAPPAVEVTAGDGELRFGGAKTRLLAERDPSRLPWGELDVDVVVEATGRFRARDKASLHLEAGARRVLLTAPGKNADLTVCMGVNDDLYDPARHHIVSNASCTTNCLAPVARVLHDRFGIETGFLTTVHAYTSSQAIIDGPSGKWRRGRAGAVNIVPTTTGAAIATAEVVPELEGRLDGLAMRVPVPAGSIIDLVAHTQAEVTVDGVNDAFREAAGSDRMRGILGVTDDEVVSSDIIGSRFSSLVDLPSTMTLGRHTVKVLSWYDNESGYAQRVVDLSVLMVERS